MTEIAISRQLAEEYIDQARSEDAGTADVLAQAVEAWERYHLDQGNTATATGSVAKERFLLTEADLPRAFIESLAVDASLPRLTLGIFGPSHMMRQAPLPLGQRVLREFYSAFCKGDPRYSTAVSQVQNNSKLLVGSVAGYVAAAIGFSTAVVAAVAASVLLLIAQMGIGALCTVGAERFGENTDGQ